MIKRAVLLTAILALVLVVLGAAAPAGGDPVVFVDDDAAGVLRQAADWLDKTGEVAPQRVEVTGGRGEWKAEIYP